MNLGTPDVPWVTIIFKGGAIHTEKNPNIVIYLSRHDLHIEYVMLGDQMIEGDLIEDIQGHLMQTRTRYV